VTVYRRTGPGGLPLALRLSEGCGLNGHQAITQLAAGSYLEPRIDDAGHASKLAGGLVRAPVLLVLVLVWSMDMPFGASL